MGGLEVLSLEAEPKRFAPVPLPGVAFDVRVRGDLAYVALGSAGAAILDVSQPDAPEVVGRFTARAVDYVQPVGECLAVMRQEGGPDLVDAGDPARPTLIGRGSIPHFPCQLAALTGRWLLGVSPWEIALFDAAEGGGFAKTVLSQDDRDGARGVWAGGDRALLCRDHELQLWDVADPVNASIVGVVELPKWAGGLVASDGRRAVISNRISGLVTFVEVEASGAMRVLESVSVPGYPGRAAFHRDTVIVPCGHDGVAVVEWGAIPGLSGGAAP